MEKLRKATATAEQWAHYLEYHRLNRLANIEAIRARVRAYHARPEVRERRRLKDSSPEALARRWAHAQTPEAKQRAKERFKQRCQEDPTLLVRRSEWSRKFRTGFDAALVKALVVHQDNRCAICQTSFDDRPMRADHCHTTGKPRGLLCHHCNIIDGMMSGIGLSAVEYVHRLIAYREKPPASTL